MRMLLSGLHHIHVNNVVHRDLKPENCLLDSNDQLRIIDFGLSKMASHEEVGQLLLGTPYFMAPEVYTMEGRTEAYKQPLDCWSAGVLMYLLISGEYPFNKPDLSTKILNKFVTFDSARFDKISFQAKDLIRGLLKKDRDERLTAGQSLEHPFFSHLREKDQLALSK